MVFMETMDMWRHNDPFETSEHIYQTTRRKFPVDLSLH